MEKGIIWLIAAERVRLGMTMAEGNRARIRGSKTAAGMTTKATVTQVDVCK